MILLIDGYNVVKLARKTDFITEKERSQFIQLVIKYARTKQHEVVIVFDKGSRGSEHKHELVQVVYSGYTDADTFIKEYIKQYYSKDLLLVSSDRELVLYAQRYGIVSLDSAAFLTALVPSGETKSITLKKATGELRKSSTDSSDELDALMESGTEYIMHKKSDIHKQITIKQQTRSKHERKLHRVIKKI